MPPLENEEKKTDVTSETKSEKSEEAKVKTETVEENDDGEEDDAPKAKKSTDYKSKYQDERKEKNDLKKQLDDLTAWKSKMENEIAETKSNADARVIQTTLRSAAKEHGMLDLDDLRAVDVKSVKVDKQGEVSGVDELFETLKKNKPHFFADPKASTSSPTRIPSVKHVAGKKASDMTKEEANAQLKALGINYSFNR